MADDTLEDQPATDAGKVKRAPPTIELERTEVSGTTKASAEANAEAVSASAPQPEVEAAPVPPTAASTSAAISPWVIAPFSGAVAAALVILVGWMLGWPAVQAPPAAPQVDKAMVDDLGKRVAALEGKVNKPVEAIAPGLLRKLDSLPADVANLRAQVEKLAAAGNEMKSAPQGSATATVDLAPLNDRIAKLEEVLGAAAAQGDKAADSKALDDLPLRRLVAAALLDVAVRHGDPFAAALATAKALSPNPDLLKPLDQFAEKGVPNPPALNRELLTLVPKLSAPDAAPAGTGLIDKLQAGASKLVRVERTDSTGNDRAAIVARVTAAAIHNDFGEARRELSTLSADDRAPAQAWLDKAAARDAALAASRHFADQAMAALAQSPQ
jgi:hypothetical protein